MLDRKFSAAQVRALIQVVLGASLVVLHTSEAMEQAKGGDQPVHQVNFWMHWVPLELIKRNNTISNKRRLQYTLFYFNEAETYHGARIFFFVLHFYIHDDSFFLALERLSARILFPD